MMRNGAKRVFGVGFALLALVMVPGCLDESVIEPTPVAIERLNPASAGTYSGLTEPMRAVVRDAVTFANLWKAAWTFTPAPAVPEVDFATHVVLVVALGEQSSGGYAIRVAEVVSEGYGLRATVLSPAPGTACAVPTVMTQPVEFVSVPAKGAAVRFEEEQDVTPCK
jgi:hypothetical protein